MAIHPYQAVMFDLLTGLLDSWSLWNKVARSEDAGFVWRKRYLELTFDAGSYRSYEDIVEEAGRDVGLPRERAGELIRQWGELAPWPEAPRVVRDLTKMVPVAVVTNTSLALAKVAVACLGVRIPIVVTAEEAGYYKPHPRPYRMALERLGFEAGQTLFVAGSPGDVHGASRVGLPVYWHNRMHLPAVDSLRQPLIVSDSLLPILEIVRSPCAGRKGDKSKRGP
jgi:2-haloalkanoic acid dehalogenase type II